MPSKKLPVSLVVATSTFPRWSNDTLPRFVLDFSKSMSPYFVRTQVLAPHYANAKKVQSMHGLNVKRFRYAWPQTQENIVYNGGGISKVKKNPLYAAKLLLYCLSLSFNLIAQSWRIKGHKIINAHWLIPQGTLAVLTSFFTASKTVITIHGGDVFALNGGLLAKIKRWTLKHADLVIVNSSATQQACRAIYKKRDYPIIPMGIDTQLFRLKKVNRQNGGLEVLFVGRIVKDKGLIYLCRAIKQLAQDNLDVHLNIAGEGPELNKLRNYITTNNLTKNITLLGGVLHQDLPSYYSRANVFVGPSIQSKSGWQEAFGLVFAEALACGTPVIATDTGGIRDIIKDGQTGFIVPQKNSKIIAEKLMILHQNPKLSNKMGLNGAQLVHQNFSWPQIAKSYIEAIESIIS